MGETHQSMSQKYFYLFLLCCFPLLKVSAQYTELLNANRPGGSQGAFAVGTDVIQIETGFSYGKEKHSLLKTETSAWGIDYALRYGFWKERLEISMMGEYHASSITHTNYTPEVKQKISNFKSNTFGVKYLLYDPYRKRELKGPNLYSWRANNKFQWEDLIPAISLYVGANLDFADNPYLPSDKSQFSPKFVLSTQNNWVGGWVFVTNIVVDRISTDFPSYGYILTLTHATHQYFSLFIENQGIKSDFYADQLLRAGAVTLINPDFHVDLSVTANFKDTPSVLYGRLGLVYRFDNHSKDEYLEDIKEDDFDGQNQETEEGEEEIQDMELEGER